MTQENSELNEAINRLFQDNKLLFQRLNEFDSNEKQLNQELYEVKYEKMELANMNRNHLDQIKELYQKINELKENSIKGNHTIMDELNNIIKKNLIELNNSLKI